MFCFVLEWGKTKKAISRSVQLVGWSSSECSRKQKLSNFTSVPLKEETKFLHIINYLKNPVLPFVPRFKHLLLFLRKVTVTSLLKLVFGGVGFFAIRPIELDRVKASGKNKNLHIIDTIVCQPLIYIFNNLSNRVWYWSLNELLKPDKSFD